MWETKNCNDFKVPKMRFNKKIKMFHIHAYFKNVRYKRVSMSCINLMHMTEQFNKKTGTEAKQERHG